MNVAAPPEVKDLVNAVVRAIEVVRKRLDFGYVLIILKPTKGAGADNIYDTSLVGTVSDPVMLEDVLSHAARETRAHALGTWAPVGADLDDGPKN
jgi:hypothetical protein